MAMVLILVCISLVLTVVSAVLLAQGFRPADAPPAPPVSRQPESAPPFFQSDMARSLPVPASPMPVPIEALLLRIEQHVRLEQAVAESFHLSPTPESLRVHTASPLMH